MENENKKRSVGAIWIRKSKAGDKYMNLSLDREQIETKLGDEKIKLIAFINKHKETDNQPDLTIYFSEPRDYTKDNEKFDNWVKKSPPKKEVDLDLVDRKVEEAVEDIPF